MSTVDDVFMIATGCVEWAGYVSAGGAKMMTVIALALANESCIASPVFLIGK